MLKTKFQLIESEIINIRKDLGEVKHRLEFLDKKVSRISVNYIELENKVEDLTIRLEKIEQKLAA